MPAMWVLLAAAAIALGILVRWSHSGQTLIDYLGIGLVYLYARIWHRWSCNRPAPLPRQGAAILVSNHTCSADPAFLTAGCARVLSFLLGREFYHVPILQRLLDYMGCVPVRRRGCDVCSVRTALRRLAEGRVVCIFPQGGLSQAGTTRLGTCKAGVALIALRSGAPVYPACITMGPHTNALLKSWLEPSRVHVIFGAPIDLSRFQGRRLNRQLLEETTAYIMERIVRLRSQESGIRGQESGIRSQR